MQSIIFDNTCLPGYMLNDRDLGDYIYAYQAIDNNDIHTLSKYHADTILLNYALREGNVLISSYLLDQGALPCTIGVLAGTKNDAIKDLLLDHRDDIDQHLNNYVTYITIIKILYTNYPIPAGSGIKYGIREILTL